MFLKCNRWFKDGKEPRYCGIVESRRCAGGQPRLKILMVTGLDESCLKSCRLRPDRFLQKPFEIKELLEVVQSLIGPAGRTTPDLVLQNL